MGSNAGQPPGEIDGFLDKVWDYFLRDHEQAEEDVSSEESEEEILSEDGFESYVDDESDDLAHDDTNYTEPEDNTTFTGHEDETKDSTQCDSETKILSEDEKRKALLLAASLSRTAALLEYAKQMDASKKKASKGKAKGKGKDKTKKSRDKEKRRKRFHQIPEDREYSLEDAVDDNSNRVGPPQMIFVQNDVYEIEDDDRVHSREIRKTPRTSAMKASTRSDEIPSTYFEKESNTRSPMKSNMSSNLEEMQAKRKEIHRRIALLRIRAAKARMAKENAIIGPPSR
eukprot:CAMPEP_0116125192 /NCGR_PEP_ID=MMETSP0329-20121206/5679_1 /TAXON_ID=697910 /ORGANISM="Pseudo-nitzschia arenysensis, Strain B593" /LENGTH=284 /DNA_ID=CAMNT_0003619215 /DNA_START=86 /DNA_END=937 /DNA_ORIENTATION=-